MWSMLLIKIDLLELQRWFAVVAEFSLSVLNRFKTT